MLRSTIEVSNLYFSIHSTNRNVEAHAIPLRHFSFFLLNFSGMGQDGMRQDLREHTIYAFIHGGASTDSGVMFFFFFFFFLVQMVCHIKRAKPCEASISFLNINIHVHIFAFTAGHISRRSSK